MLKAIYIATFTLSNLPRIKENNSEVIIQFKIFYSGGKGWKFTSVFCPPPPPHFQTQAGVAQIT